MLPKLEGVGAGGAAGLLALPSPLLALPPSPLLLVLAPGLPWVLLGGRSFMSSTAAVVCSTQCKGEGAGQGRQTGSGRRAAGVAAALPGAVLEDRASRLKIDLTSEAFLASPGGSEASARLRSSRCRALVRALRTGISCESLEAPAAADSRTAVANWLRRPPASRRRHRQLTTARCQPTGAPASPSASLCTSLCVHHSLHQTADQHITSTLSAQHPWLTPPPPPPTAAPGAAQACSCCRRAHASRWPARHATFWH